MIVRDGGLDDPQVVTLLDQHARGMLANSPPGTTHFLDLSALRTPDIRFFSAWEGETLLGIGALKMLDAETGEIKSMRTAPDYLRKGVAAALLDHIIDVARACGYRRLSLETGSGPAFEPALSLYRRRGFVDGAAFGDYERTAFNQFLHLDL